MRASSAARTAKILSCYLLLFSQFSMSQIPQALGKLQLTSTRPGASITINGSLRREKTPVTLAVAPGDYKIVIGNCAEQTVHVSAGETNTVDCTN